MIHRLATVCSQSTARRWRWSSFRAYAYQEAGPVRLNDWSAHKLRPRGDNLPRSCLRSCSPRLISEFEIRGDLGLTAQSLLY